MSNSSNSNSSSANSELLEEVVDEFTRRLRAGEHPSIAEYQEKFPTVKSELEDVLASVAMIEQLKPSAGALTSDRGNLEEVSSLQKIGVYTIVGELGRGGMGIVFEAIHESLGRRVAIKVMPTPLVNSSKHVQRFEREAQAAAKLHHTNIVSVFGAGEGDGFHYYVMDWVDGRTLSEIVAGLSDAFSGSRLDETKAETLVSPPLDPASDAELSSDDFSLNDQLDASQSSDQIGIGTNLTSVKSGSKHFRWAARIGANIADALSYAHQSNILHRDIKPSNMILDRKGTVWITDFGLAKDNSSELNLTKTGDVVGTPRYLAPESLEGKYDQRSEVYCLGLTLYELATLQPAYAKGTTAEIIGAIATSSPPSPRKVNSKIPIDLSTIIDKAIARDPSARYQTAEAMRADLLAFIEDRPIKARPPSTLENIAKWSRRNPMAAMLSAVSAILLSMVAASTIIGYLFTIDALKNEATKSAQLASEKIESEHQRKAAVKARNEAQSYAEKMKAQYDRADANVDVTLEAFDEMFSQVISRGSTSPDSNDVEGFEELMGIETTVTRKDTEFLEKLLAFYDRFANQNADNEALLVESARAFRRAGNIHQLVGQYKPSIEAYRKSINLYQRILDDSDSKNILVALVKVKSELARVLRRESPRESWPLALKENQEAISLLESVPVDQLDDELKFEWAKTLNSLGSSSALIAAFKSQGGERRSERHAFLDIYRDIYDKKVARVSSGSARDGQNKGKRPRGKSRHGARAKLMQSTAKQSPDTQKTNSPKRGGNSNRGARGGGMTGTNAEISKILNRLSEQSLELLDQLIESDPQNIEYRSARANTYCSLAASQLVPDPDGASDFRRKAIHELEFLIEQNKDNPAYRFRLALACMLGDFSNPSQDNLELLDRSVELTELLKTQFPQVPDYHSLYGSVMCKESQVLIATGEFGRALKALRYAKNSFDHVVQLQPDNRHLKSRMNSALLNQLRSLADETRNSGKDLIYIDSRALIDQIKQQQGSGRAPAR